MPENLTGNLFLNKMHSKGINKNPDVSLEQLLNHITSLGLQELKKFQEELNRIIARKKAPPLPQKEASLLKVIFKELPKDVLARYDELYAKVQTKEMMDAEHQELLNLVDIVENRDVERLKALVELSQIRGITVDQLMKELQIKLPVNAQ